MEGILNFIIIKISCPLLYKIISFHIVKHFSTDSSPKKKKKKISQTRNENFQSKKKKEKSFITSRFIIGNRNE